ncbi:hypothetical protein [Cytobacillus sp. IB215316]|uniref:hypothetical protein n=1 Tax=Cytobacillus sp. IB215316 TaxID=3097354 RepID=UPI002A0F731D|nr:hypothetical protein [Cytobacillus sp. IB215316]MDX8359806.1 hypothetical protein [Cytobacillus sp. IB215316]
MADTRQVAMHKGISNDRETLSIITIYEPGINKQQVKVENPFTKNWGVLLLDKSNSEWVREL